MCNDFNPIGYRNLFNYYSRLEKTQLKSSVAATNSLGLNEEKKRVKESKKVLFQLISDHQFLRIDRFVNANICLTCEKADGYGDIKQTFLVANTIQKHLPNSQISIVLQSMERSIETIISTIFPENSNRFPINLPPCSKEKEYIQSVEMETDCFLGVALPIHLPPDTIKKPYIRLKEYGFSGVNSFIKSYSMGLASLEEGLVLPTIEPSSLNCIQTEWLKEIFQQGTNYLETHQLYHMYVHDWWMQIISIYATIILEVANSKPIDVVIPLVTNLDNMLNWKILDLEILKSYSIGQLTYVQEGAIHSRKLGEGKELRLISGRINEKEMEAIQFNSQPIFGSTGDCSVSNGFVLNRVQIIEQRDHKKPFLASLNELAKTLGCQTFLQLQQVIQKQKANCAEIYQKNTSPGAWFRPPPSFDLNESDSVPRKSMPAIASGLFECSRQIADLCLNPAIFEEMTTLNNYIRAHYNIESKLISIVKKAIAQSRHSELKAAEKELWKRFEREEITEEEIVQELNSAIEHFYPSTA